MKRRYLNLCLGALLCASAWAQPPVAWWENPVANGLTLSDAQRDRINVIVREHRDALMAAREAAEKAERELDAVFNSDTVDYGRGRAAIEQLVQARGDLTRNLARMTLRLRTVLTSEQWLPGPRTAINGLSQIWFLSHSSHFLSRPPDFPPAPPVFVQKC